jgi:hypothetical protein
VKVGDLVKFSAGWRRRPGRSAGIIIRVKGTKWIEVIWADAELTWEHVEDLKSITEGAEK